MQMKPIGISSIVAMCIAGSVLGCTWVPLTDAGGSVRIVEAGAAADCRKISTVNSKTTERVVFARSDRKIREELESLARNEAAVMGGNAVVPVGVVEAGRQSFEIYRCQEAKR